MKKYEQMNREELELELQKCEEIVEMLSNTVLGGFAKMSLEGFRVLNASEGYYRMTGYTEEESHLPPFSGSGLNLLLPEDFPRVRLAVDKLLTEGRPINVDYRIRKKDGVIAWNTAFCSSVKEDEGGQYLEVFFLDCTHAKNTELQLISLLNNMSSGLIRLRVNDGVEILYANNEFYRQIGYSPREFSDPPIGNNYLHVVHPVDREALRQKALAFTRTEKVCPSTRFRIMTGQGETRWMQAYVSRLYEEAQGDHLLQCVLTDVTREHEQERQNMLNEERFRIISEQTRDVVFDWDITNDSVHYSPVFEKMFGFPPPVSISTEELLDTDLFYEEDKAAIKSLIADLRAGMSYVEARARMKGKDGTYFWTQHRATVIFDEDRSAQLIVGIVSDVNDFMQNTIDLQHRAEHDPLTGLLNRQAGRECIERILRESGPGVRHVFMQFDIDHFKQINDFMGHAAGDFALQRMAMQMRETFRSEDVLVRMGGDEFAAFLVNPSGSEGVYKKLRLFLQAVYGDFKFGEKIYPLSVSMGTAIFPKDGADFQELYERADAALYQAKRAGGNRLEIFTSQGNCGRVRRNKTSSVEEV